MDTPGGGTQQTGNTSSPGEHRQIGTTRTLLKPFSLPLFLNKTPDNELRRKVRGRGGRAGSRSGGSGVAQQNTTPLPRTEIKTTQGLDDKVPSSDSLGHPRKHNDTPGQSVSTHKAHTTKWPNSRAGRALHTMHLLRRELRENDVFLSKTILRQDLWLSLGLARTVGSRKKRAKPNGTTTKSCATQKILIKKGSGFRACADTPK